MADISFVLEGDINAGRGALGLTAFVTLTAPTTVLWTAFPRKPTRYYITPDPVNNVVILPEISASNTNTNTAKVGNSIFVINASGADSLEVQNSTFMPIAGLLPTEAYIITAEAATGDWFPTNITGVGGGPAVLTTKGDLLTRNSGANVRLPVGTDGQILTADSVAVNGIAWKDPAISESTFDIVPVMITASSPGYTEIGNFAWDDSVYGSATSMKIVAWIDSSGNRGIDLQVYDATNAVEIGRISLAALSAVGPYTTDGTTGVPAGSVYVPITVPVSNVNIQIRTRKTAGGGASPTINGIQLHLAF